MQPDAQTIAAHINALPRKRVGAGVLFFNDADGVLLLETTYKAEWEIPGGAVHADESPLAGACREVREELGIEVTPVRLLCLDWVPVRAGRVEGLMVVYDGGVLTPAQTTAITFPDGEIRAWHWCNLEAAQQRLLPHVARRVAACMRAHDDGSTAYLEFGNVVM